MNVNVDGDGSGGDGNGDERETKRQQIREHRETTIQTPEFMRACRRTKLRLGHGEHARAQIVHVDQPLILQGGRKAQEAFFRYIPTLDRPEDEEAYYAACRRKVRLVTTHANEGGWYCQNVVQSTGHGKAIQKERCLVANRENAPRCTYCHAPKPTSRVRPFFAKLSRLSSATKKQRDESLRRIHEYDSELSRSEHALTIARSKLEQIRRHRAESSSEPIPEDLMAMDVDLAQRGVPQRVNVQSLIPMLVSNQHRARTQMSEIRGELCVLVQALYGLAAPSVQKVVRGHLLRIRLGEIRRQVMERALLAAAVEIQRLVRSHLARSEADRRRRRLRRVMAIRIQCVARGMLARQERRKRHKRYLDDLHRMMATRIQCLFRSWRAKLTATALAEEERRRLRELERAREAAAARTSCILLQSCARRYLAIRRVAQRRIELSLHDRLLRYADRLMIDGDVWSFLKCINDDYRRYEAIVDGILEREDTMASTFVSRVVALRRQEYESAWKQYEELLKQGKGGTADQPTLSESFHCESLKHAAATCNIADDKGEEQPRPNASRYHMYKSRLESRRGKTRSESSCQPLKPSPGRDPDSFETFNTVPRSIKTWESDRLDDMERAGEMERAGLTFNSSCKFSGGMLLREIPDLLDDTLRRLLYAASIRCHVPSFMDAETNPEEAYETYLKMPIGLQKARHESESKEAVEPLIDQLRHMGFTFIRDVMPRQNLSSLLKNLTLPVTAVFISTTEDILTTLEEAARTNHLSRKNLIAKVSSFMQQQRDTFSNQGDTQGEGSSSPCDDGTENESIVESLPGGLWSTKPALSDVAGDCAREPIQGSPYKSRRCGRAMTESVDDASLKISKLHPTKVNETGVLTEEESIVNSTEIMQAQTEFQQKLNDLVSSALTKERSPETVNEDEERPLNCDAPNTNNGLLMSSRNAKEISMDGLFTKEAFTDQKRCEQTDCKQRETKRKKNRCWAVQYTTQVLDDFEKCHPAYRSYRRGVHLR